MLEWKDREADGEGNLGKERWERGVAGKVRKSLLVWLEAAKRRESKCIQQPPAPAQDQDKKPSTSGPAPAQSGRLSRGSAQRRPLAASADQRATHFSLTCPDHPTMRASICSLRQHQHTTHSVFTANGRPISPAIRTSRRDSLWRPQPFSPPPPPSIRADQPTRPNLSYRPADFGPLHSLPQPPQPPECALELEHLEAHNRIQIFVHVGNPCTTLHRPE